MSSRLHFVESKDVAGWKIGVRVNGDHPPSRPQCLERTAKRYRSPFRQGLGLDGQDTRFIVARRVKIRASGVSHGRHDVPATPGKFSRYMVEAGIACELMSHVQAIRFGGRSMPSVRCVRGPERGLNGTPGAAPKLEPANEKGDGDCSPSPQILRPTGLAARFRPISASRTR